MHSLRLFAFSTAFLGLALTAGAAEKGKGCGAAAHQGPSALMLLQQKAVREDLKLTDAQAASIREASVKQYAAFLEIKDLPDDQRHPKMVEIRRQSEAFVAQTLQPEQKARLQQIELQLQGGRAFFKPEIAQALSITPDQQQQMRTIHEAARKEFAKFATTGQPDRAKAAELRHQTEAQVFNVLSDAQKARWKEMTGAPIPEEVRRAAFGWQAHRGQCPG